MPVTKGTPRVSVSEMAPSLAGGGVGHKRIVQASKQQDERSRIGRLGSFVKSSERSAKSFLYEVHRKLKFRPAARCPAVIAITYVVNCETHA
jgi:hypothetical protein